MALLAIRLDTTPALNCRCERVNLRRKLVRYSKSFRDSLFADSPDQGAFLIEGECRDYRHPAFHSRNKQLG